MVLVKGNNDAHLAILPHIYKPLDAHPTQSNLFWHVAKGVPAWTWSWRYSWSIFLELFRTCMTKSGRYGVRGGVA
ncbi:hypothetical protein Hdeb2414_s0383g00881701 [Helianthus debilis subsp. tardiflorus]